MHQKNFKNIGKTHIFFTLVFAWLSLFSSSQAHAGDDEASSQVRTPIAITANLNPFIIVLGLPTAENGSLTATEELQFHGSFSLVNNSISESKGDEFIILDGETYYSLFSFKYGLNDSWEVGFKIPYIVHNAGYLDGFIKSWHNILGLSNDRREVFEDNQLLYNYSISEQMIYELSDNTSGWGDPFLTAALDLSGNHPTRNTALRFSAKIPVGNADKLTGNEAHNISIALAFDDILHILNKNVGLVGQGGYLYLADGKVLEDLQRKHVGYGSLGLNYPFTEHVIIKTQIDAQSSFYNSELLALGRNSIQLTLGGSIQAASKTWIDFGIVENLQTDTTPDVIFYAMINTSF